MKNATGLERHRRQMQSILATGYPNLRHCRYLLLHVTDDEQARAWLTRVLATGFVRSVAQFDRDKAGNKPAHGEAVVVAFSYRGLARLGLQERPDYPFPSAFRAAMASPDRAPLLGDTDRSTWRWSDGPDGGAFEAHMLVAHYRASEFAADGSLLDPDTVAQSGFEVREVGTCPSYIQRAPNAKDAERWLAFEPFGFRDGIAQPWIKGLRRSGAAEEEARRREGALFDDRVVATGEFVLGQINEYGERAYCPDVIGWAGAGNDSIPRFGLNGSYLAVRQIRQDVAAFRQFVARHQVLSGRGMNEATVAEKMVGRKMDGSPLITRPHPPAANDAFRYLVSDADGFQCPRGSHVRRANPRDLLGWDEKSGIALSKLHRLLRRGRVYTETATRCDIDGRPPCGDDRYRDGCGKGLFFIALNADPDRQFEFVQQRWIANSKFGDLSDEVDPILGASSGRAFSIQGCRPIGTSLERLPQFTEVTGGGYFFLPSLPALEFIARPRPPARQAASCRTTPEPDRSN